MNTTTEINVNHYNTK